MHKRLAVVALALIAAACGSDDDEGSAEERPGSPDVYARIEATSDCAELQTQFDTAMDNVERYEAGSPQREAPMAYAEAAEDRRQELDC